MPVPETAFIIARNSSHNRDSDDTSGLFSLDKMPRKRRKSGGLNYRLASMLRQLDTSLVADPSSAEAKRVRNLSSDTSSSTAVSETPPFTIGALRDSVRGKNLGEKFAIIKNENSPRRSRLGYTGSRRLASWRDLDQQDKTEREDPELEIPTWLMHTFASLEPDHPLRALAVSDPPSSAQVEDTSTIYQGLLAPEETPNQGAKHNKPVFTSTTSFINNSRQETVEDGLVTGKDASGLSTVPSTLAVHADGLYALRDDDRNSDRLDALSDIRPFAQPGPFVQKSVHFMTPSPSSPIADSDHLQANSSFVRSKETGTEPCGYNPFSTPGPAAFFSLPSCNLGLADTTLENDHCSDSLTLANDSMEDGALFAFGAEDEDSATSVLSFASNPERLFVKPFSTPGPTVHSNKDSAYGTVNYAHSDIPFETGQPRPDSREAEKATSICFKTQDNDGTMQNPSTYKALELAQEETLNTRRGNISPRDSIVEYLSEPQQKPNTAPHERQDVTNASATIELSSSPPCIRFKQSNIANSHACNYPLKNSAGQHGIPGTPASPDMRLPIPSDVPYFSVDGSPALPCTPRNCRTSTARPQIMAGHVKNIAQSMSRARSGIQSMTPRRSKERPAFNSASGVYVSPIQDSEYANAVKEPRSSKAVELNENIHEKMWNFSASQLSDDSIEDWAT